MSVRTAIPVRATPRAMQLIKVEVVLPPVTALPVAVPSEELTNETIQVLTEKMVAAERLLGQIRGELGVMEWASPEHAEKILNDFSHTWYTKLEAYR